MLFLVLPERFLEHAKQKIGAGFCKGRGHVLCDTMLPRRAKRICDHCLTLRHRSNNESCGARRVNGSQ